MKKENVFLRTGKVAFIAMAMCVVVLSSCDDDDGDEDTSLNATDKNFVMDATYSNRAEIEMGALAITRGESEAIRMFGQRMIDEHEDAMDELQQIADDYDLDLPDGLKTDQQQMKDSLENLEGMQFDSVYIHSQVMMHEQAETLFQNQNNNGKDQRLKSYANKYLPNIQRHLEEADSLANAMFQ